MTNHKHNNDAQVKKQRAKPAFAGLNGAAAVPDTATSKWVRFAETYIGSELRTAASRAMAKNATADSGAGVPPVYS